MKLLYFVVMFIPAMLTVCSSFLSKDFVFLFFSICAPRCFSHEDVVTLGALDRRGHTLSIARTFLFVLHARQSFLSQCIGLNGSDSGSNLLIATPALSTTLILSLAATSLFGTSSVVGNSL